MVISNNLSVTYSHIYSPGIRNSLPNFLTFCNREMLPLTKSSKNYKTLCHFSEWMNHIIKYSYDFIIKRKNYCGVGAIFGVCDRLNIYISPRWKIRTLSLKYQWKYVTKLSSNWCMKHGIFGEWNQFPSV